MNLFEKELQRMQIRVEKLKKNMADHPDPTKLKSNVLLYELDIEQRKAQIEALKQGKPFPGVPAVPGLLGQAMGFVPAMGALAVPNVSLDQASEIFDDVRTRGLVGDCCDMPIMIYAILGKENPSGAASVVTPLPCTIQYFSGLYHEKAVDPTALRYHMDVGFEESDANLEHVVRQMEEFIELFEKKIPGVKYDEDYLVELQYYSEKARDYYKEIYEMLKHRPCPLGGRDAVWASNPNVPGIYPNPERAVEYARARRDEVAERVEKGIAAVPGEKLRFMWTVTRPMFMDIFSVLEKWKIVVPMFYAGTTYFTVPAPRHEYYGGRELKPLEKEAAKLMGALWSSTGSKWTDTMKWIAKDLGIDGIVNYNMRGGTCTLGLQKLVEDSVGDELGIPILQLEGAQFDMKFASADTITSQLNDFSQHCLSLKGLH